MMAKRGRRRRLKRLLWPFEYVLTLLVLGVVRLIPFRAAVCLGGMLGSLVYKIDKRHQRVIIDNIRQSFKDKTDEEVERIARSVYTNTGRHAVEFMRPEHYSQGRLEDHFEFVNFERLENARARGKGVLLLTAHCGSWEIMALMQSIKKPPFSIVVRPLDNPYLEKAVSGIRTRFGNTLINKTKGMREILRALGRGDMVGILLDQSVARREGVFVDFFGRPACTNKGLALLALKTKAPVVPAFTRRLGLYRHEIWIGEEMPLIETGDKEADIAANTQAYTKVIEDFVRKYPEQWFWMHRRWKTRPEGAPNA